MKKIAAIQSNYIPWKGYFDIIHLVNEFILYDDVQYTPKNWRNRNRIKTPRGLKWLTVPVVADHDVPRHERLIKDMKVANHTWPDEHWGSIQTNYARTRHFDKYKPLIKNMFMQAKDIEYLSDVNMHFLRGISRLLHINTEMKFSMAYNLRKHGKSDRPLELAKKAGADVFVSGPTAAGYYDLDEWNIAGVKVEFVSYDGYPEYWQPYPPFEHGVSIIDVLFNVGDQAQQYMKSFR